MDNRQPISWDFAQFGMDQRIPPISPRMIGFNDAFNAYFTPSATYRCRPGHAYLGGTVLASNQVDGVFDFWVDSATQYTLVAAGGNLYKNVSGTWTAITLPAGVISTAGKPVNFASFGKKVVFGNGVDHNGIFDGTTVTDLNGQLEPCKYFETHGARMYAAGSPTHTSRVFWCAADNPSDWTTAGDAGFKDFEAGNDIIIGIQSFYEDLYIFKGEKYLQVFIMRGTSYQDFSAQPLFHDVSGYHRTIIDVGNDLLFQGPSGIYSLNRLVSSGGDLARSRISDPIQKKFNEMSSAAIGTGCAVYYDTENIAVFYMSKGGSKLDTALVVSPPADLSGKYRWSYWTVPNMTVAAEYYDDTAKAHSVICGLQDGSNNAKVTQWVIGGLTDADGSNFNSYIKTPFFSLGNQRQVKGARHLTMTYLSAGGMSATLTMMNGATYTKSLPTTAVGTWGSGTWGSGVWGSATVNTTNIPLRGISTGIQVSLDKTTGTYELYDVQLDVMVGGRSER